MLRYGVVSVIAGGILSVAFTNEPYKGQRDCNQSKGHVHNVARIQKNARYSRKGSSNTVSSAQRPTPQKVELELHSLSLGEGVGCTFKNN